MVQKDLKKRLRSKYFKDIVDIRLDDFKAQYKEVVFTNDDDAVKVTLIYDTEFVMMDKNKVKSNANYDLFGEAEDLNDLNSMDWRITI